MKKLIAWMMLLVLLLTACGYSVDYKDSEDRKNFTEIEMEEVKNNILALNGVKDFKITQNPEGVYSVMKLDKTLSKREIESLVEEAFYSIKRETIGIVDLYVKVDNDEETLLAQVYKPPYEDKEDRWDIFYDEK